MRVLASKCENPCLRFDRKLFTEVVDSIRMFTNEEWEEHKKEYKKVLFAVYVRTDLDNLVLTYEEGKFAKIFDTPPFILSGGVYSNLTIDSGNVCGKSMIDFCYKFNSNTALERFVSKSTCYPVGAVETSKNYILVFNVVVSSDLLKDAEIHLNEGLFFRPIETLNTSDSIQKEIAESLVIVKNEVRK